MIDWSTIQRRHIAREKALDRGAPSRLPYGFRNGKGEIIICRE